VPTTPTTDLPGLLLSTLLSCRDVDEDPGA
jgi:hypothetical protein